MLQEPAWQQNCLRFPSVSVLALPDAGTSPESPSRQQWMSTQDNTGLPGRDPEGGLCQLPGTLGYFDTSAARFREIPGLTSPPQGPRCLRPLYRGTRFEEQPIEHQNHQGYPGHPLARDVSG